MMGVRRAEERGSTITDWLMSRHSFSFNEYYDPSYVGFGMLRVLNDDIIAKGAGFGTHGHRNMEIVTIMLDGMIEHSDSTGARGILKKGEVQTMSAGRGIMHAEINPSKTQEARLLQIWIYPKAQNTAPIYEQRGFDEKEMKNTFLKIVSGHARDDCLHINQDVSIYVSILDKGKSIDYASNIPQRGLYIFLISGQLDITTPSSEEVLFDRDALALVLPDKGMIKLKAKKNSYFLLLDTPYALE